MHTICTKKYNTKIWMTLIENPSNIRLTQNCFASIQNCVSLRSILLQAVYLEALLHISFQCFYYLESTLSKYQSPNRNFSDPVSACWWHDSTSHKWSKWRRIIRIWRTSLLWKVSTKWSRWSWSNFWAFSFLLSDGPNSMAY